MPTAIKIWLRQKTFFFEKSIKIKIKKDNDPQERIRNSVFILEKGNTDLLSAGNSLWTAAFPSIVVDDINLWSVVENRTERGIHEIPFKDINVHRIFKI